MSREYRYRSPAWLPQNCQHRRTAALHTHVVDATCGGSRVLLQGARYAETDRAEGGALEGLNGRVEAGVAEVDVVDLQHIGD